MQKGTNRRLRSRCARVLRPLANVAAWSGGLGLVALLMIFAVRPMRAGDSRPPGWTGRGSDGKAHAGASPYRFSADNVIWTAEQTGWNEWRGATHWPVELVPAGAAGQTRPPAPQGDVPGWLAWPERPGHVRYAAAWGWPWPALVNVDEVKFDSVPGRRVMWWGALADWLVLTGLAMPMVAVGWVVGRRVT